MGHASDIPHLACPGLGHTPRVLRAVTWIEAAFRTLRERRQLMALDDHALKDIGLSRADAHREWCRPFWDLPRARTGERPPSFG
jgi:uncharacterized protein YjiS (DUF1127 family)